VSLTLPHQEDRKFIILTEPIPSAKPLSPNSSLKRRSNTRHILGRAVYLLIALGVTVAIAIIATQIDIEQLRRYGYPGVFLASLLANATIALPVPGVAVTIGTAVALPDEWWLVALVGAAGEALGESTAYLAGYGGSAIIENRQMYQRLQRWMERHGMATVFAFSVVPNPFVDLAGLTAGASNYPFYKFMLACWLGKSVKTLIICWAAVNSATWLLQWLPPG
jgi:membrane protein YqaA with SNARE-associated domain